MNITAYYPVIFTKDIDSALKSYTEDLGFTKLHSFENDIHTFYVLELNGSRVDIFTSDNEIFKDASEGFFAMRVNVRDFDEGLNYYQEQGYKIVNGPVHIEFTDFAILTRGQKDSIFLYHHIRKEDRVSE